MPFPSEPRPQLGHATTAPSPLRQASNASTSSSVYTTYSNPFPPSRSSTISSNGSIVYSNAAVGHKRGISEATGLSPNAARHWTEAVDINSTSPKSLRPSLKTLAQAPMAPRFDQAKGADKSHSRSHSIDGLGGQLDGPPSHNTSTQHSLAISRSDSTRYAPGDRPSGTSAMSRLAASSTILEKPDLHSLQKSTTKHLRTLSQFAEEVAEEDFAIKSPEQEVVGMHGRRRLKRASSTRGQRSAGLTGYGGRTWMDQQRQYLQAYEYLCHIGEAKEWIEDVMHKQIPPIVQLEEALRDGVTLAEVVQGLNPDKAYRIFRNPKLQFRHSDNIAIFFRYLSDVELPELFRFELVDLYAKKNIPKVIYCIHALSWLLYRKGIVNFRIGNLVGQLHFDVHELEQTQKGLDKAGISMPNFSGMVDTFGEPSMISDIDTTETEEEKSHRELMEADTPITDLQAQMRACILRSQLGTVMQNLWDSESLIIKLQSHIRGDWMREIVRYRLDMRKFAINLQSAARAFGVRTQSRRKLELCRADDSVATLQSIVRGYRSRAATQRTTTILQDNAHGVRTFQALVKGAMKRWEVADQYYGTRNAEKSVASLQSMARGFVARKRDDMQRSVVADSEHVIVALQSFCRRRIVKEHLSRQSKDLKLSEPTLKKLQAVSRASLSRASQGALISSITEHEATLKTFQSICRAYKTRLSRQKTSSALLVHNSATTFIQARCRANVVINHVAGLKSDLSLCQTSLLDSQSCIRGYTARQEILKSLRSLDSTLPTITSLQSASRGFLSRQQVFDVLCELQDVEPKIISLQTHCRGMLLRLSISADFEILAENELAIIDLQAAIKGFTVRRNFVEKQKFYNENIKKVIKIQSFVRARQQGEAYKSLTSGINPPVSTIKSFIHLLNDSEFDFDGEIGGSAVLRVVVAMLTFLRDRAATENSGAASPAKRACRTIY